MLKFLNHIRLIWKHSSENFRLIAYGNFSKIVNSWIEKFYIYNQGVILGEAKEGVISGLPFESFARFG